MRCKFFISLAALILVSCKDSAPDKATGSSTAKVHSNPVNDIGAEEELPHFAAIGTSELNTVSDQFFSVMGFAYERRIGRHQPKGDAQFSPYSGSWYPEVTGGTNASGALTKYDRAFGTSASQWEREVGNHTVSQGSPTASWEGHCNGFSAAAARHEEPPVSVTKNGQTFSPAEIKALLAEVYMSAERFFLGGIRCERDNPPVNPVDRPDPERMGECEDINPASFHLAMTNVVGGREPIPVIMDFEMKEQVWNYPVCGYRCTNCGDSEGQFREVTEQRARALVAGTEGTYEFNRGADKFFDVQMDIYYANATGTETFGQDCEDPGARKVKSLRYVLEVNDANEVVGGEWATSSRNDHPDFVWFPLEAKQGDGKPQFANPHVDPAHVLDLWRASWRKAGFPSKFEGKKTPTWRTNWGVRSDYTVELDGSSSGAVYLGKRTRLRLKVTGARYAGHTVQIRINGVGKKSFHISSGGRYEFDFDAVAGLNLLSLSFEKGGQRTDEKLRFYAIP